MRTAAGPPKGLDLEASSIVAKAQGTESKMLPFDRPTSGINTQRF